MAPSNEATKAASAGAVPEVEDQPVASSSKTASKPEAFVTPEVEQGATGLVRASQAECSKKPEMTAATFDPDKLSPEMHKVWQTIEDAISHEEQLKRERAAATGRKRKRSS